MITKEQAMNLRTLIKEYGYKFSDSIRSQERGTVKEIAEDGEAAQSAKAILIKFIDDLTE